MARRKGTAKKTEIADQKEQMKLTKPVAAPVKKVSIPVEDNSIGRSAQDAIDLRDETDIPLSVNRHLERMFGVKKENEKELTHPRDNDYFVISEQVVQTLKRDKKFKVVYVEDSKGKKHQIFFLLPFTRI